MAVGCGLAVRRFLRLAATEDEFESQIDGARRSLVNHVDYRTGRMRDMKVLNKTGVRRMPSSGDLAQRGALPIALNTDNVDLPSAAPTST